MHDDRIDVRLAPRSHRGGLRVAVQLDDAAARVDGIADPVLAAARLREVAEALDPAVAVERARADGVAAERARIDERARRSRARGLRAAIGYGIGALVGLLVALFVFGRTFEDSPVTAFVLGAALVGSNAWLAIVALRSMARARAFRDARHDALDAMGVDGLAATATSGDPGRP